MNRAVRHPGRHAVAGLVVVLSALIGLSPAARASTVAASSVTVAPGGGVAYAGFDGAGFSSFARSSAGLLTPEGQASTSYGASPLIAPAIAASPDGQTVYGVDAASGSLFQYSAEPALTLQATYPVSSTGLADPSAVVVSPDDEDVYVLSSGLQAGAGIATEGEISTYARNLTTGDLTFVGATTLDPSDPGVAGTDLVVSPDSQFVYVADAAGITVLQAGPGGLDLVGQQGATAGALGVAMSPDGSTVYESGPSSSSPSQLAVDVLGRNAGSGELTPEQEILTGPLGASTAPMHLAVTPGGGCLYESDQLGNALNWFGVTGPGGSLTYAGTLTEDQLGVRGLADPGQVATAGGALYVASAKDDGVGVFYVTANCSPSFTQLAQDLFTLGTPDANANAGTATLPVNFALPGSARVTIGARSPQPTRTLHVAKAGTRRIGVSVTGAAAFALRESGTLKVRVDVTFTAAGGSPTTRSLPLTLTQSVRPGFGRPVAHEGTESLTAWVSAGQSVHTITVALAAGARFALPIRDDLALSSGTERLRFRVVRVADGRRVFVIAPVTRAGQVSLRLKLGRLTIRSGRQTVARITVRTSSGAKFSQTVKLTR